MSNYGSPRSVSKSVTLYPTLDAWFSYNEAATNWATIISSAGSGGSSLGNSAYGAYIKGDVGGVLWNDNARGFVRFDTSSLAGSTISSATLYLRGADKLDTLNITPNVNIYESTNAGYSGRGTTPFSSTIAYASWSVVGYNAFALNAAGLAYINLSGDTDFKVCNASYDVGATEPGNNTNDFSQLGFWCTEKGAGYKPYLVVNYSKPGLVRHYDNGFRV